MKKNYLITLMICVVFSCVDHKSSVKQIVIGKASDNRISVDSNVTVELLINKIMSKPLANLSNFSHSFSIKDTVMEDDDDGGDNKWKAKAYFDKRQKLSFLAETNWQDTKNISRVTVFDKSIKTKDGVSVGMALAQIKIHLAPKIVSTPDGYLIFQDGENKYVYYNMDISKYRKNTKLQEGGISNIEEISQDIKVSSIVIQIK